MTNTPSPTTLAEEDSSHGLFWKLNTVKGITIYNALCSFLFLPLVQLCTTSSHDVSQALFYVTAFFSFELLWVLMLVPALLLRLLLGGRGNVFFGLVAAALSLFMLSALYVMMGEKGHGSLMLAIYLCGAYKLVVSHFGLRSLGIPLSLPEWREPSLIPDTSPRTGQSSVCFSPILRVCYFLIAFLGLTWGAICCFNDVGDGVTLSLTALLPAYPFGRLCLDAYRKAVSSYRRDYPEKTLCYAIIGIITTVVWSVSAIGLTAFLQHHWWRWFEYAAEEYVISLLVVLVTQLLLALYLYLRKRFPVRQNTAERDAKQSDPAQTPAAPRRSTPRITKRQVYTTFITILLVSLGWFGYTLRQEVLRCPQNYSDTTVQFLAREAYDERMHARQEEHLAREREQNQPEVDVLPAYCSTPTETEAHIAKQIAAIYLQEESPKYRKMLLTEDAEKGQAVKLYTMLFGGDANIYTVCRYVISELPQPKQTELMEELGKLPSARWSGTADKEEVLDKALRELAYARYRHPREERHGGILPCPDKELQQQTKALVEAVCKRDAAAIKHAIESGGDIETEVFPNSDMTVSFDTRKQRVELIPLLHYALRDGYIEGVEILLQYGALPQHVTPASPDCWLALSRAEDKNAQRAIIRIMRQHGVKPNGAVRTYFDSDLQTELQ